MYMSCRLSSCCPQAAHNELDVEHHYRLLHLQRKLRKFAHKPPQDFADRIEAVISQGLESSIEVRHMDGSIMRGDHTHAITRSHTIARSHDHTIHHTITITPSHHHTIRRSHDQKITRTSTSNHGEKLMLLFMGSLCRLCVQVLEAHSLFYPSRSSMVQSLQSAAHKASAISTQVVVTQVTGKTWNVTFVFPNCLSLSPSYDILR
jgi:hypothetical protein